MEIAGIKFVPFSVSPRQRLETLAAGLAFGMMTFGGLFGLFVILYIILYTHHWPEALLYLFWIWTIDIDTCDKGGRPAEWVRQWSWWEYLRNYFPTRLERVAWVELDPKRNYLFACFPHGIFPMGAFSAFATSAGGFNKWFPNHRPYILTLKLNFLFPIMREIAFSLGVCSASAQSLNWLLGAPEGGNAVALIVGGAEEAYYCRPGQYRIVLKKRKGFIKIALRNGSPLVPVFSFGETDVFNQVDNPKGSLLRRIQDKVKGITGVAPIVPMGRGYTQYSFGWVPFRKPIHTIIGKPLEVEKVEYPSQEQIDSLHEKFTNEVIKLFEEQKHLYIPNHHEAELIIV